jgi:hypothetical protein
LPASDGFLLNFTSLFRLTVFLLLLRLFLLTALHGFLLSITRLFRFTLLEADFFPLKR